MLNRHRRDDQRLPAGSEGWLEPSTAQTTVASTSDHLSWNVTGASRPAGATRATGPTRRQPALGAGRTARAQGLQGPQGPRPGPAGPAGPPGPGLTSLDDLDGLPCNGGAGTVDLTYDGADQAALTCVHCRGGGGDATLSVNELMTGVTGAAIDEFVEIVEHRHRSGRSLGLEARLPLGGGNE